MRIVYLSGSGQLGGAERCLLDVMQAVRCLEPSWDVTLVSSRPGPIVEHARALGIAVEVVAMPESVARLGDSVAQDRGRGLLGLGVRTLAAVGGIMEYRRQLRRVLKRHAPDIVHTNGFKMHIMGAWSRPSGAALVWHLHDYISSRPLMVHAVRHHSRYCDAAIAVSHSVARDAAPMWRGRTPVQVVLNGVNLDEFNPSGRCADLDALAGLPPAAAGTVRVGLVATMGRFKGHDVFLRAIARLPRSLPVRAYVVGGALYETRGSEFSVEQLRALAGELGVGALVGFTGFIEDPSTAIRALDIVVHATVVPEPFGLVVAEGMACARAVITSAAGGAGELVRDGEDALVHEPGSVEGLASAIQRLVEDPGSRHRLGEAGRRSAELRFDRRRVGEEVMTVYRSTMAHGSRARASA
ncbi:MAG: glycosyltransferase family 4 protein [Gemmatimonadaceae bacterium]